MTPFPRSLPLSILHPTISFFDACRIVSSFTSTPTPCLLAAGLWVQYRPRELVPYDNPSFVTVSIYLHPPSITGPSNPLNSNSSLVLFPKKYITKDRCRAYCVSLVIRL